MNHSLLGLFHSYVIYYTAFCHGRFASQSVVEIQL